MKKIISEFFILLFLLFNIIGATPITSNVFKEGVYDLSDFEVTLEDKIYKVQNVSPDKSAYIIIFNNKLIPLESIMLPPKSINYNIIPLKSSYNIAIVGDGEVYFS